jgi:hypothetical protein
MISEISLGDNYCNMLTIVTFAEIVFFGVFTQESHVTGVLLLLIICFIVLGFELRTAPCYCFNCSEKQLNATKYLLTSSINKILMLGS